MRIAVLAVGRMRPGPEKQLCADRIARFDATGRQLALGPARVIEIDERKARGRDAEAAALLTAAPDGLLVALDERGARLDSRAFADRLARARDDGAREIAFAIGGADGHGAALIEKADWSLSLGRMVWPHMLARAMLAEQLYRAASILAGSPYHRD